MAAKYSDEYDDAIIEDDVDVSYIDESDDDEFDSEYLKELRKRDELNEKKSALEIERERQYQKRIAEQLANSGPCLEGKLNWCNPALKPAAKPTAQKPASQNPSQKPAVAKPPSKRFGKGKPMEIDIRVGGTTQLVTVEPEPVVVDRPMCHSVLNGTKCKYGAACRFSHIPVERKTQKIRMCRNVNNCRFGTDCIYAHSESEVKDAVSICNAGVNCRRVRKEKDYVNTVIERKCMRLHPRETISNYIARTS